MNTTHPIPLAGTVFQADLDGALFWPEEATLVVADLHLEKGSSYASRGRPQFLPPYDTSATIGRLERLLGLHSPKRVICLGDSTHDSGAADRIDMADTERIRAMTVGRDWIWITGNHDPEPPPSWGGTVLREVSIGNVVLRHQAGPATPDVDTCEISGHFHPTAKVEARSARISARCFASGGSRLLLPAFGAYAGGLNVLDPAIARLFDFAFNVVMLGRRRLFAFSSVNLRA
jgi:DNA ligase-associated metallophosphoesterase